MLLWKSVFTLTAATEDDATPRVTKRVGINLIVIKECTASNLDTGYLLFVLTFDQQEALSGARARLDAIRGHL